MNARQIRIASECLEGADSGGMTFPEIVSHLMAEGFESYSMDFRTNRASYYLTDGAAFDLPMHAHAEAISAAFDPQRIEAAVREAQRNAPGYTYPGFCRSIMTAGCVGYTVSFPGRRAVYYGRTAETHVEHFPA